MLQTFKRNVTKFAARKALNLTASGKLTFDERVVLLKKKKQKKNDRGHVLMGRSVDLGRIPRGQTDLFNSGTNSNIGTSRVQFVLGFSSRKELKAINTRSVCPLAIRARVACPNSPPAAERRMNTFKGFKGF